MSKEKKNITSKKPSQISKEKRFSTSDKVKEQKEKLAEVKSTEVKTKIVKRKVDEKVEKDNILEQYLKAGEIAFKVIELLRTKVKVGVPVIELCEAGEAKIKELGGNWAFPVNVSINNIAAHYSSPPEDDLVIQKGDVVKVDCGVQINGYVADTAFTVSFNADHKDLIKASEEATKAAIDLIRPGIMTDRIGTEIENIIRSYDFRPIRELSGHQLDQNILHGPITIPNVSGIKGVKLEEGQAFAIETFASTGTGKLVKGEGRCFIYQLNPFQVPIRLDSAKKARKIILTNYPYFPFTLRWIAKELPIPSAKLALNYLASNNQLKRYPVLSDEKESFVSQAEHTVYLTGNSRIVTTLPKQ